MSYDGASSLIVCLVGFLPGRMLVVPAEFGAHNVAPHSSPAFENVHEELRENKRKRKQI